MKITNFYFKIIMVLWVILNVLSITLMYKSIHKDIIKYSIAFIGYFISIIGVNETYSKIYKNNHKGE